MKAILHIGTEKTGTTTLQYFLFQNRSNLLKQGFLYPARLGSFDHQQLCIASYDIDRRDELTRRWRIHTDRQMDKYRRSQERKLKSEIRSNGPSVLILSCELFQSRLTTVEDIARFRGGLERLGVSEFQVVIYLRDPATVVNSRYTTQILVGSTEEFPPPPTDPYSENLCNYRATLDLWASVFGKENLLPRVFERSALRRKSLIDDFLFNAEIEKPRNGWISAERKNTAISHLGLAMLRRINGRIPQFVDDFPNLVRVNLIEHFQNNFSSGERFVMANELWEAYDKAFAESNEAVRSEWFPDREKLFSAREPAVPSKVEISNDELDAITNTIADIWISTNSYSYMVKKAKHAAPEWAKNLVKTFGLR